MKQHLRVFFAIAVMFVVAGCSRDFKSLWDGASTVATATVPGYTVVAAAQAFDGSELVAAAYLGLPICRASSGPICRIKSATPVIKGAFRSGRIARGELKAQVRTVCAADFAAAKECSAGIPVASYNTLIAATKTINDATAAYRAATGK